jgi:hypothetical protein
MCKWRIQIENASYTFQGILRMQSLNNHTVEISQPLPPA